MLDRASTFADPEIVDMLKSRFVPVAIDQAYQRRQQDTEGEFYRRVAGQGPRNNFEGTTQGFYIATAAGDLLLYNNNRNPAKVRRLMKEKLAEFNSSAARHADVPAVATESVDRRYNPEPPDGGLVVRVHAKVLNGYPETSDPWQHIFQSALSRDNLWISAAEHRELAADRMPVSLRQRIARFHLVDNTRGEPPMWQESDVQSLEIELNDGRLHGSAHLETADGKRGYQAELLGFIETQGDQVVRFDLIASGSFWGAGRYTRGAPTGRFPLAVSFSLADGTQAADKVPPQGSRGWLPGYLR